MSNIHDTDSFDTIGGRLASAREAQGHTTSQAARRLGVKTKTLSDWESDRSEPRANRLVMLAGMLNISPAWILTGQGDGPSTGFSVEDISLAQADLNKALEAQQLATQRVESAIHRLNKACDQLSKLDLETVEQI